MISFGICIINSDVLLSDFWEHVARTFGMCEFGSLLDDLHFHLDVWMVCDTHILLQYLPASEHT